MRINRYLALSLGISRRKADYVVNHNKVLINGVQASLGTNIAEQDMVTLNGKKLEIPTQTITIMLNKPVGYVCSRDGQGSKTIYELIPEHYQNLNPIGRLDKDSSGLLLLTNDGNLAHKLTHPSFQKQKVYQIRLDKPLSDQDKALIERGINLEDGISSLNLQGSDKDWQVTMAEGRNRQIRRTFAELDYSVTRLRRLSFADFQLGTLPEGKFVQAPNYPENASKTQANL